MRFMKKRTSVAEGLGKRAVKASSAAARRVEDLVDLVRRRLSHIAEDFYDMGVALRELASPKLYTAVGCTSFEELLGKYRLGSHTQAYRAMAVVKAFPNRDEAIALGFEKCAAVLSYASATKKPDVARAITESGKLGGKSLATLSVRDIDKETSRVRKIQRAKGAPTEREVRASRAARELKRWLGKHHARPAAIDVHEDHRELWVDVRFSLATLEAMLGLATMKTKTKLRVA